MTFDPPPIPLAVVEWLEKLFPDRFPDLSSPDLSALHRQAGQVEIIRLLRQHAERAGAPRQPTRTQSPF